MDILKQKIKYLLTDIINIHFREQHLMLAKQYFQLQKDQGFIQYCHAAQWCQVSIKWEKGKIQFSCGKEHLLLALAKTGIMDCKALGLVLWKSFTESVLQVFTAPCEPYVVEPLISKTFGFMGKRAGNNFINSKTFPTIACIWNVQSK